LIDSLDRAYTQIAQAEDDINKALAEKDPRVRQHSEHSQMAGLFSIAHGDISLNNLQIAEQMGETNTDHAVHANTLR